MRLIVFLLTLPLILGACQEIDDWTRYQLGFENDLIITSPIRTLDASPEEDTLNVIRTELFIPPYDKKLEDHGDERGKVEKVRMLEFHFNLIGSDTINNMDFLQSINAWKMNGPGLEELVIGRAMKITKGSRGVEVGILFPWEQDMRPYLENGYQIVLEFTANEQIPDDIRFRCSSVFQVDVRRFGI